MIFIRSFFIFSLFVSISRHQSSNTLGRFSKSTNRLQTSPSDLDYDYRSAQTLPRKLEHKPMHSSAINIAIVNNSRSPPPPPPQPQSQGPAKPARTYKSINRSKSFNVHGLNGTNNPSPIYMEKLNRNQSHHYRSNPHLNDEKSQLRSPSIVNLISRSQRDLSKIDENGFGSSNPISASTYDVRRNNGYHQRNYSPIHYTRNVPVDRRAQSLLRTTSDNYRTDMDAPHRNGHYKYGLERNFQRERESSLGSRSPLTINKDTAAIIRRNSSSTEDYSDTYKTTARSDDPYRPSITNTVHNFTKKSHPAKNGRGSETIETSERKSISSRYRNGDNGYSNNLRYVPDRGIRKNSASPVIIEVRRK